MHALEKEVATHSSILLQGNLPRPGIKLMSPALAGGFFAAEPPSTKILTK